VYALYQVATLPVTLGDPNSYVIAMTLSVLEGRFPIANLRTVSAAFCCSAEVSTH